MSHLWRTIVCITLTAAAFPVSLLAKSYAVVVGIARYEDPGIARLSFAARDADAFAAYFRARRVETSVLRDGEARATAIARTIREVLVEKAGPQDDVFLVLSGRGFATRDYRGGYIPGFETRRERPGSTAFSTEELSGLIRQSRARRIFVFADLERQGDVNLPTNLIHARLADITAPNRLSTLLAVRPGGQSVELGKENLGAFTNYVVRLLSRLPPETTMKQLFGELANELTRATDPKQQPDLRGEPGMKLPLGAPVPQARRRTSAIFVLASWQGGAQTATPNRSLQPEVSAQDIGQDVLTRYGEGGLFPGDPNKLTATDFSRAARAFETARRQTDDAELASKLRAKSLFAAGRALLFEKTPQANVKARELLTESSWIDCHLAETQNALGIAYLESTTARAASLVQAREHFALSVESAPDWAYARHNLALAHIELGDYAEAERQYREAIRRTPWHPYLYYNLGALLQRLNRRSEAAAEYRQALLSFDRLEKEYRDREESWARDGDHVRAEEARTQYETARRNRAEIHNALGALRQASNWRAAEQEFQTAARLNPDLLLASYNLGALYYERAQRRPHHPQFEQALTLWRSVVARDPEFVAAHVSIAGAHAAAGRPDQAIESYNAALRINRDLPPVRAARSQLLGEMALQVRNAQIACAHFREALPFAPPPARSALLRKVRSVCSQ